MTWPQRRFCIMFMRMPKKASRHPNHPYDPFLADAVPSRPALKVDAYHDVRCHRHRPRDQLRASAKAQPCVSLISVCAHECFQPGSPHARAHSELHATIIVWCTLCPLMLGCTYYDRLNFSIAGSGRCASIQIMNHSHGCPDSHLLKPHSYVRFASSPTSD